MGDRSVRKPASLLTLSTPLPLTEHPATVYLSSLSTVSERSMREALNTMAVLLTEGQCNYLTLDWAALRYKHTAAFRAVLVSKYAPATVNKMMSGLKRVMKEALRLELIDPQDYARAIDIKGVKASVELSGRALTSEEISSLLKVCTSDPNKAQGLRDAALIAILRGSGMRRAEAINLDLKDLNRDTGAIRVLSGKGRKDRTVFLPKGLLILVKDWLNIRGLECGPIFCHIRKGGQVIMRRLTSQSVLFLLEKRAVEAGVEAFSPHDFRRTFISDLLDAGVDLASVQKLAGHADPGTTSRYDRRGEEVLMKAVQVLDI